MISPATLYCGAVGFLKPLLCVGSSVQKCLRHFKIVDMSDERTDQSMRTTLFFFFYSSEVCSDIFILGLVLSLVFAQKAEQHTSTPQPSTLD